MTGLLNGDAPGRSVEAGVAEIEDTTVGRDQPVRGVWRVGRCRGGWAGQAGRAGECVDLVGRRGQEQAVAHRRRREVVGHAADRDLLHRRAVGGVEARERATLVVDRPHETTGEDRRSRYVAVDRPATAR